MDKFVELISKPIADAFFPLLKDKNKPERYTQLYNYLYNDVSKTVKEYFTANSLTTKKAIDAGITSIIRDLAISLKIIPSDVISATPSDCPGSGAALSEQCFQNFNWASCGDDCY